MGNCVKKIFRAWRRGCNLTICQKVINFPKTHLGREFFADFCEISRTDLTIIWCKSSISFLDLNEFLEIPGKKLKRKENMNGLDLLNLLTMGAIFCWLISKIATKRGRKWLREKW